MKDIWAIVLAAGESKRMGSPKMILPFGDSTIIRTVVSNIFSSEVRHIMIVLGAERDHIRTALEGMPVKYCYNSEYRDGMLSSVKCGIMNLPDDYRAVLVFPGDQPTIDHTVLNLVINTYIEIKKGIVVPVYKGRRGHPLLADRKYRDEILGLDGPDGLRGLARQHPDDVVEVATESLSILRDIDTREDYLNELSKL